MENLIIRELDKSEEKDIIMYERALYRAFAIDRRIEFDEMRNYDHKQKRCTTKKPYTNQHIVVAQLREKIIAAVCVNLSVSSDNEKTGEILHVFNNSGQIGASALQKIRENLLEKAKSEGFTRVFANCFDERFGAHNKENSNITIENVKLT